MSVKGGVLAETRAAQLVGEIRKWQILPRKAHAWMSIVALTEAHKGSRFDLTASRASAMTAPFSVSVPITARGLGCASLSDFMIATFRT